MPTKVFVLMLAALSFAAFGCGDDEEPASGGGSNGSTPQNVQEAVDACKQSIEAQPNVSQDVKDDLTELCEKAGSGDEEEAKKATREVCTKLIEESVPPGEARDTALETCRTATE